MVILKWASLFAVTAALALGQDSPDDAAIPADAATPIDAASVSSSDAPRPVTAKQRAEWVVSYTVGPQAIIGEAISAGLGTWRDKPSEWGTHWDGFGKRAGADFAEAAVSHTMEAGLGAIWGEDPRYARDAGAPFKNRLGHVFKMTFLARDRNGNLMPAYARFIAIPSSAAISEAWRPPSEQSAGDVGARIGLGVLGRMSSNAFNEFWPDVRRLVFRRRSDQASFTSPQSR
ncbi:MAG: hypothetical protein ABSB86_16545 [Bryobacteraceae bacterium]